MKISIKKKDGDDEDITESLAFKLAMQELTNPPLDQLLREGKSGSSNARLV